MTQRQFSFFDRTLALLLSLGLAVPSQALALRPLNAGLEERNPVNEQLKEALVGRASVTTPQTAGMEESKSVLGGRIFKVGLVTTAALTALLGLYGWLKVPSQPPASATPSTTPPLVSALPEPESVEETIRRADWALEAELARVDAMTQINGVPIEEIEGRARPEADALTGFLGREDGLKEVLKEDLATLHQLGWTKEEIARHLKNIVRIAKRSKADRVIIRYLGQPLEVIYIRSHGDQDSILRNPNSPEGNPDNWPWSAESHITNLKNGLSVLVGGDVSDNNEGIGVPGYIERYGFFEGGGVDNPYRVDPAVLDAILTGKKVTKELKRLKSVSSDEFLDKRWQEQLKAKIDAEKETPRSPKAEEAFKGALKRMPPEVVRELLELARKRDREYAGKWGNLSEKYHLEIRFSYGTSGDVLSSHVLHFHEGNLNLYQQVEVLEAFLKEAGQSVPQPKPGAEGPAPDPAGLEEEALKFAKAVAQLDEKSVEGYRILRAIASSFVLLFKRYPEFRTPAIKISEKNPLLSRMLSEQVEADEELYQQGDMFNLPPDRGSQVILVVMDLVYSPFFKATDSDIKRVLEDLLYVDPGTHQPRNAWLVKDVWDVVKESGLSLRDDGTLGIKKRYVDDYIRPLADIARSEINQIEKEGLTYESAYAPGSKINRAENAWPTLRLIVEFGYPEIAIETIKDFLKENPSMGEWISLKDIDEAFRQARGTEGTTPATGLEEVKEFGSVETFARAYGERLTAEERAAVEIYREAGAGGVMVLPGVASRDSVIAYAQGGLEEDVEKQLGGSEFIVTVSYPDNGKVEDFSVVIKLADVELPADPRPQVPIIAVRSRSDIGRVIHPALILSVAVNKALAGKVMGPIVGVITFEDEQGRTLHAVFV